MCELTSGSAEHWPRLMASQAQDINVTNPHSLIIKAAGFRHIIQVAVEVAGDGFNGSGHMSPRPTTHLPIGQLSVLVFAALFPFLIVYVYCCTFCSISSKSLIYTLIEK